MIIFKQEVTENNVAVKKKIIKRYSISEGQRQQYISVKRSLGLPGGARRHSQ